MTSTDFMRSGWGSLTNSRMLTVLILVASVISSSRQAAAADVIHVSTNGTSNSSCWTGGEALPCNSLQLALTGLQSRFNSKDTTILVHGPGRYSLPANTSTTVISGASNIAIAGSGEATIDCQSGAGLVFVNSSNVSLTQLTLRGCGKQLLLGDTAAAAAARPSYSAGLLFHTCQHITIDGVTITNSSGLGTILQDTSGLVLIRHSVYTGGHSTHLSVGGGLWVAMGSQSTNHTSYSISDCQFENNSNNDLSTSSRGAGMMVSLLQHANVSSFSVHSCTFTNNSAHYGGGLYVQLDSDTSVRITNCSFDANQGQAGAAMFITAPLPLPGTVLPKCVVITASAFKNNEVPVLQNMTIGIGSVYSDGVSLCLAEETRFTENQATALVMSGAHLTIAESSQVFFIDNTGHNGGALALLDTAYIIVSDSSSLTFTHNRAQLKGGAIYSSYYSYAESAGYKHCLVQYVNASAHPNEWNVSFVFEGNTASQQTNSIYTPSIYSCVWPTADSKIDIHSSFCWRGWKYLSDMNCSQHIETAPAYYQVNLQQYGGPMEIGTYPGKSEKLPLQFFNDESKDVTSATVFNSILSVDNASVSEYTTGNRVTMFGQPGTQAILTLGTLRPRVLKTELEVTFWVCPPGFTVANTTNNRYGCVCKGHYRDSVICDEESLHSFLRWGRILTYNESSREVLGGAWRVFMPPAQIGQQIQGHFQLPNDSFKLNDFMCGNLHRKGFLCKDCINGTSAPIYSYEYSCVNCSSDDVRINWLLFLVLQTVPVTLLFLVVTVFNISATSGPLNAFIFYSQVISNPSVAGNFAAQLSYVFKDHLWVAKLILSIFIFPYGIWNLDCLPTRSLIPPFCVGENMRAVDAFTLNYLIGAVYPLLLIGFLFVCIELHARDFRPLVWLWRCFGRFLTRWRRNWNIRTSVIDAFATFMLLSYTKFCFLSLFLLVPMNTYNSAGDLVGPTRLYFDPSVIYGGPGHIPYMVLSVLILIFVVLLPPIFLLLYPLTIFQRMLAHCRMRGNAVRTYVEAFQGCYKDGTNGTSDCRYFASVYFGLRIVAFSSIVLSYDRYMQRFIQMTLTYLAVMMFSLVRPYKRELYNRLDIFILTVLGIVATFGFFNAVISNNFVVVNVAMMVTVIIPLGYFIGLVFYRVGTGLRHCCRRRNEMVVSVSSEDADADRVVDLSSSSSHLYSYDRVSLNSNRGAARYAPPRGYASK